MTLSVKKINTVSAEVKAFVENNKGKPVPHVDQPDQPTSPFFPVKIGLALKLNLGATQLRMYAIETINQGGVQC